ncbi:alpha-L-fucosidase [Cyclobacterium plantarum]|uniref:alpha-L-fucosidase n=1 Tax=Cyclobacterium plantarum TaxID=2716263 RepID=A0ABX0H7N4_9BACT|nr:alpha-L-fucosidase [Cyclobacterium plantarum]NHE57900.1 alpha-L-fucosidase [Cyclobacterium plantarum]
MRNLVILSLSLFFVFCLQAGAQQQVPIPSPAQLQWQQAELAALVCWDMHVFDGEFYVQPKARITPVEDYNTFNPQKYDMDQWIRSLKDAGFKIAIFTVSHETGFFFHQSNATPYSMKALKWQDGQGDILRDFKATCEKYDILPAVYIGTRWNAFYGVYDFKVQGENEFARNRQEHYNRMIEKTVKEIFTNYGDWAMVWFDGGAHGPEQGGPDVLSIFEQHQPNNIFYHNLQRADIRWGGSETGTVPYPSWGTFPYPAIGAGESAKKEIGANNFELLKTGDPKGSYYMPAMSDAPLRGHGGHDWFWEPNREHIIYPLEDLVKMYYNSVGHNSTLILGVTPNADGLMPEPDVKRLKEFGEEIDRRFSNPLARISGRGNNISLSLEKSQAIDHIVLQEDISKGELVREFILEAEINGKWTEVYRGSSIGHKHIVTIDPIHTDKIRFVARSSRAEPQLKSLSVYKIDPAH